MLHYPSMNPVALSFGPLKVHWYGLMYAIGFMGAWLLGSYRARQSNSGWTQEEVSDLLFYTALGIILGGRIGYLIFYNLGDFLAHPWIVFAIWEGGMSFHGGLLGVALAFYFFSRKRHKNFFDITDFVAPLVPVGLGTGRIGNFINGELWGRVSQVSWAMIFPHAGQLPRHPSQLYEFFLEGVVLFLFLWIYSRKKRPRMRVSGWFLFLYGIFRVTVEAFRQPDVQLGFIAWDWLTMGQLLSIPMIFVGLLLLLKSR